MTRLIALVVTVVSFALAGCGGDGDEQACAVNSFGNKLCGQDALAYCNVIDGWSKESKSYDTCIQLRQEVGG